MWIISSGTVWCKSESIMWCPEIYMMHSMLGYTYQTYHYIASMYIAGACMHKTICIYSTLIRVSTCMISFNDACMQSQIHQDALNCSAIHWNLKYLLIRLVMGCSIMKDPPRATTRRHSSTVLGYHGICLMGWTLAGNLEHHKSRGATAYMEWRSKHFGWQGLKGTPNKFLGM